MTLTEHETAVCEMPMRSLNDGPRRRTVSAEAFCELVVSSRPLYRVDDPDACLRGLYDPETDEHFLIAEAELAQHRAFV